MKQNTVIAILFISVAIFGAVAVFANALIEQAAMQAGLQQCVVTLEYGVKTAWQKECSK